MSGTSRVVSGTKMPRWSKEEMRRLIAWYTAGVPLLEIAERLGRSYPSVVGKLGNYRGVWQVKKRKPS